MRDSQKMPPASINAPVTMSRRVLVRGSSPVQTPAATATPSAIGTYAAPAAIRENPEDVLHVERDEDEYCVGAGDPPRPG